MNWYIFFSLDLYPSGLTGLEPAASALTGRCSDQLNYNPRKKSYSIHTYSYNFIQTLSFSIWDSTRCIVTERGGLIYLLINIIYGVWTLARSTRITSNPFVIAKSIEKNESRKQKKESFFFTFILFFDFILMDTVRNLAKSKLLEKIRNTEKRIGIYKIYILPYTSTLVIFRDQKMAYIIWWWITKFLGRAGFEPA